MELEVEIAQFLHQVRQKICIEIKLIFKFNNARGL